MLRKGSIGLKGTYENANHHAKECLPIIDQIVSVIDYKKSSIAKWEQGSNVHVLHANDGRRMILRAYHSEDVGWGVEVGVRFSREHEIPIMTITTRDGVDNFITVLEAFMKVKENTYGIKKCDREV